MYADYEFYERKYLGELVNFDDYPKYEMKARDELDYYTRMRIPFINDENKMERVKMCECKLIDLLFNYDQELSRIEEYENKMLEGTIASETVGKHSISYQKASFRTREEIEKDRSKKISELIQKNLFMTGLLYRGVFHV